MAKALYRKYRPTSLDSVVGQTQTTNTLANSLKQGKISHAYLFVGPRGTGKTSVARIFAHEINHFDYEIEDDYVDIIEIDGASNRGIEDIRDLREKATIAPSEGKFKVYIIDEVHMLTREAFNALLKTLEEPPKHVVFIMATTELHKVPATILSRAQVYHFNLADKVTIKKHLAEIAKKENIPISDEALDIIVERGGGSFRDSISLLDQISTLSSQEINAELVISAMGLPLEQEIKEILDFYTNAELEKITDALQKMLTSGIKAETITEELIRFIVSKPTPELLSLLNELITVTAPFPEAKLLVALTKNLQALPKRTTPSSSSNNFNNNKPHTSNDVPQTSETASQPVQTSASTPQSTQTTTPEPTQNPAPVAALDWQQLLDKLHAMDSTAYPLLQKAEHEIIGDTLHIYPKTKGNKMILSSTNNQKVLKSLVGSNKIIIHDAGKNPITQQSASKSNPKTDKLSDIMGGEVIEYGGEDPFESE